MATIHDIFPDPKPMLALEPEELAGYVLEHLHSLDTDNQRSQLHRGNFINYAIRGWATPTDRGSKSHPRKPDIEIALLEAWSWLERDGLLAAKDGTSFIITRRGMQLQRQTDVSEFQRRNLFPLQSLHATISQQCYSAFLRGEYDTAVFQAFKAIEVAVRTAGNFGNESYGAPLMRKAFGEKGRLANKAEVPSEQKALADLFAGAIGRFKNPTSHRHVELTDPAETIEILCFASHLMRVLDDRKPK